MTDYDKVLLLRRDGKVEAVRRLLLKTDRDGKRSIEFDKGEDNVKIQNIVEALDETAVGNNTDAVRKMQQLKKSHADLTAERDQLKRAAADEKRLAEHARADRKAYQKRCDAYSVETKHLRDQLSALEMKTEMMALAAEKETNNMPTEYNTKEDTATEAPSLWKTIINDSKSAVALGAGMGVSDTATEAATALMVACGVPKHALEHPIVKVMIQAGGPVGLRALCGVIPGVKDNKVLDGFLAGAQKAALASVAKGAVKGVSQVAMPAIGMLMSAASAQKELEGSTEPDEPTVTQVDDDGVPITVED